MMRRWTGRSRLCADQVSAARMALSCAPLRWLSIGLRRQHQPRQPSHRGIRGKRRSIGMAKTVWGIDLGTTYSCVARVDEYGRPVVINNSQGQSITPSVVYFDDGESVVVGEAA